MMDTELDRTTFYEDSLNKAKVKPKRIVKDVKWLLKITCQTNLSFFILYLTLLIASGLMSPVLVLIWKNYVDMVATGAFENIIFFSLLAYGLLSAFNILLTTIMEYIVTKFNFAMWKQLDKKICEKSLSIDPEYFEMPTLQSLINQANIFPRDGFIRIFQLGLSLIPKLVSTVGLMIALAVVHPSLILFSLLTIVPVIVKRVFVAKVDNEQRSVLAKESLRTEYFRNIYNSYDSFREIKLANAFSFMLKKFTDSNSEVSAIKENYTKRIITASFLDNILRVTIFIFCVTWALYMFLMELLSFGGISIIFTIISSTLGSLDELSDTLTHIATGAHSTNDYFRFIDMQNKSDDEYKVQSQGIVLENLSFRYPFCNSFALKNVNVSIKEGEHIAVIGANGSGKSTFIKIISEMLCPTSGTLHLPVKTTNKCIWVKLSPVYQDFNRYKDTLRYNVQIADVKRPGDEVAIKAVLQKAGFDAKYGLDTMLGNEFGGIELSGGEMQRLAIARAFWRDREICILDEPTASIDPIQEAKIYQAFAELNKNKTTFFVSHRLGSALLADRIFFFEKGELFEIGNHKDLLAMRGKYAEFWGKQSSVYVLG